MAVETTIELYKVGQWIGMDVPKEQLPGFIADFADVIRGREEELRAPEGDISLGGYEELIKLGELDRRITQFAIEISKSESPYKGAADKVLDFAVYHAGIDARDRLVKDYPQVGFNLQGLVPKGLELAPALLERMDPEEAAGFQMRVTNLVINDVLGGRRDG